MPDSAIRGWRFDGTVSLGNMLIVAGMCISLTTWLLSGRGAVETAQRDIADLKVAVSQQAISTRDSVRESMLRVEQNLAAINGQIALLPPMSERLRRVEADITRLQEVDADINSRMEARRNLVEGRLGTIEAKVGEVVIRMEGITRASGVALPGSPGVRR